ncbi:YbjQ family protein [Methylobacterium sp.]|uniref:YbjQ family protein n=1 Tax=Methylobacterium sp. TaxID=409 RepID=UPI003C747E6B
MIIVTTETIPGCTVRKVRGPCFGAVVRSRGAVGNFSAGLRSLVGGEVGEYSRLIEEARGQAIDRMAQNAAQLGANAVLTMRFDSSETDQNMMEVVVYGTAAIVERNA